MGKRRGASGAGSSPAEQPKRIVQQLPRRIADIEPYPEMPPVMIKKNGDRKTEKKPKPFKCMEHESPENLFHDEQTYAQLNNVKFRGVAAEGASASENRHGMFDFENDYTHGYQDEAVSRHSPRYNLSESEDEEEHPDEMRDTTGRSNTPRSQALVNKANFSISKQLQRSGSSHTMIEKLASAVQEGSILKIGKIVREGIISKNLNGVQIEEFCKLTRRPNICIFKFHEESENCSDDDAKSIRMGQTLLMKMQSPEEKSIVGVKASLNSLSSSFAKHTKIGTIQQKSISRTYRIEKVSIFPSLNLTELYNKTKLLGPDAVSQLTYFYQKVLKTLLSPAYSIWTFTYRPSTVRLTDKHFTDFPSEVTDGLIDISMDIAGVYLPENLLVGDVDPMDCFVLSLEAKNPINEVMRRRNERGTAMDVINCAIARAMKNIRHYHYDLEKKTLFNCSNGKSCEIHLKWEQMRRFRERYRKNQLDFTNATPEEMMRQ